MVAAALAVSGVKARAPSLSEWSVVNGVRFESALELACVHALVQLSLDGTNCRMSPACPTLDLC